MGVHLPDDGPSAQQSVHGARTVAMVGTAGLLGSTSDRIARIIDGIREVIPLLATLLEIGDADMAIMYLRHLQREVAADAANTESISTG